MSWNFLLTYVLKLYKIAVRSLNSSKRKHAKSAGSIRIHRLLWWADGSGVFKSWFGINFWPADFACFLLLLLSLLYALQTGCTPPSAPVSLPGRLGASGRQVWCNPCGMHNREQRMVNGCAVLYLGFKAGLWIVCYVVCSSLTVEGFLPYMMYV